MPDTFVPDILSVCRNSVRIPLCFFYFHFYSVTLGVHVHMQGIARLRFFVDNQLCKSVFQMVLDGTFQWAGTELYVVAFFCHETLGLLVKQEMVATTFDTLVESCQLDVDDFLQ